MSTFSVSSLILPTIYVDALDDVRNQLLVEYGKASVLAWVPE